MAKQTGFWAACLAYAWNGSVGKANALGAVLGGLTIAVGLYCFGVTMEAPTSVAGTLAFGAAATVSCSVAAWLIIFLVRFAIAPSRIYASATATIAEMESRLQPRIAVFVEGNGAQSFALVDPRTGKPTGTYARYVQFTVAPLSETPLKYCEARLTSVRRVVDGVESADLVEEHIWCGWSNHEGKAIDIPPSIQHRANLFHVNPEADDYLVVDTIPVKVRLPAEIQTPGTYRIRVSITAQDVPTRQAVFLLHWGGKLNDVRLEQES